MMGGQKDFGEYKGGSGFILSLQHIDCQKGGSQVGRENMLTDESSFGKDDFGVDSDLVGSQVVHSPRNVRLGSVFSRRRSSIRSRRSKYSVLPLDSHECLIPQLYGDGFEIEEFVFSPVSPSILPSSSSRPFYVTDGSQVISKSSGEQLGSCHENVLIKKSDDVALQNNMMGMHALPESRECKRKSPRIHQEWKDGGNRKQIHEVIPGTTGGLLIFSIGISVGVIFSMVTGKKELEKLTDRLKQSESLIQDLQEELVLKDSLTIKELVNECGERRAHIHNNKNIQENSCSNNIENLKQHSGNQEVKETHLSLSDEVEQSESFSKIEAELEAELERLELNMSKSSLEDEVTVFDELDDQVAVVVEGELCEDKLGLRYNEQDESRCNSRGSTATQSPPVNYSVPPLELSLRLHELKQLRLEERIKDLEAALAHSQRRLLFMESELMDSRNVSSDMGSSSNQESPKIAEQAVVAEQPLCINLSGDALNAYNEAYSELLRVSETEEKPSSLARTSSQMSGDDLFNPDGGIAWALHGYALGSLAIDVHPDERATSRSIMELRSEFGSNETEGPRDNDDDIDDDEEGRSLIQQIVERTRNGSPFVLNVQKMLHSIDK